MEGKFTQSLENAEVFIQNSKEPLRYVYWRGRTTHGVDYSCCSLRLSSYASHHWRGAARFAPYVQLYQKANATNGQTRFFR